MSMDMELVRDFGDRVLGIAGEDMEAVHVEGALLAAFAMALTIDMTPADFVGMVKNVMHAVMASEAMSSMPRERN